MRTPVQAMAWAKAGRTAEAGRLFDTLLAAKPENVAILRGAIQFHNRYSLRFRRAMPPVGVLLRLRPNAAESHALAAETLCNCSRVPQAKIHADKALEIAPQDPDVLFIAAVVAMQLQDYESALVHLDAAQLQRPDHRPSQLQRARALVGMGAIGSAQALCRTLLADNPDDINVIGTYINAGRIVADDPVFVHMRDVLQPKYARIGGGHFAHLLKLLGKAQNDIGDYDAAFGSFSQAKAVLPMTYDARVYSSFVDALCTQITPADFNAGGDPGDQPVLIVGMPRSGSTLLEQILASHPEVASVGESPSLHVIVQDTRARTHHGADMLRVIKEIPEDAARKLAQRYLQETTHTDAVRVLDKSLHNFELLGIFARLLPRARIIHMRRDPMDTCVSCYMQNLSAWHKYTQNLDTLGHAYLQYDRLMRHWQNVLPNPVLEVNYEDIIADIEGVARRAVSFLGLDWDPACLSYRTSSNQTQTLSAGQVRAPLYKSSMQRWRRYEPLLDPLKQHLAPLYPKGFD